MFKKILRVLVVMALFVIFVFSACMVYIDYKPIMESDKYKEEIIEKVIEEDKGPISRKIDFKELESINDDIVAWLYIPNTSVDYPILKGKDINDYLYKSYTGEPNRIGSIITYPETSEDFSDARSIIYGHNVRGYHMFGELKKYLKEDYRGKNRKFYVYTKNSTLECEIYSIFICRDSASSMFTYGMELGTPEYGEVLKRLVDYNDYKDIEIDGVESDLTRKTITLVTCHGSAGTSNRLLISGSVINEKINDSYED